MRSRKRVTVGALWRLAIIAFLIGILAAVLGQAVFVRLFRGGETISKEQAASLRELEVNFGKYAEMEKMIGEQSIYEIRDDRMDRAVAEAILSSIDDPYAEYYTKEEYARFERQYLNSYTGIGVAVGEDEDGNVVVRRVLEGGPAEAEGVQPDDIILTIDGKKPESVEDASERIAGDAGTEVTLQIGRNGEVKDVSLYRTDVEDKSVHFEEYDEASGIGYIRIDSFREGTADGLKDAIRTLTDHGFGKLVIDLRGNTGGVTDEGVRSADLLLPACRIMTAKNRDGKETAYNSDESMLQTEFVLLVDENTASAAEIFAGAIQRNHAAKVVGTKTYGKGMIQGVYKLPDGSAFKLTIEEYFLPDGEKIDGIGITPDVEAEGEDALSNALYLLNIGENK